MLQSGPCSAHEQLEVNLFDTNKGEKTTTEFREHRHTRRDTERHCDPCLRSRGGVLLWNCLAMCYWYTNPAPTFASFRVSFSITSLCCPRYEVLVLCSPLNPGPRVVGVWFQSIHRHSLFLRVSVPRPVVVLLLLFNRVLAHRPSRLVVPLFVPLVPNPLPHRPLQLRRLPRSTDHAPDGRRR